MRPIEVIGVVRGLYGSEPAQERWLATLEARVRLRQVGVPDVRRN